jgi:epsilon-lactone hydrolase
VEVKLDIFPEQQHTFQMCTGRAPEANQAISKIADWARPKLGHAELDRSAE